MAVWSVALESCKGQQDLFWTQGQNGGLTGILRGCPPARVTSGYQLLGQNLCSTLATQAARPRGCRRNLKGLSWLDLRHIQSQEVLWVTNIFYKPAVDLQLAALDVEMGALSLLADDVGPLRPAGYERVVVTAETVSVLCSQGHLGEAVEALGVLVQTECCVSSSLLFTILKRCVGKRDVVLGRRVHAFTVKTGYESDTFLGNHIVRLYASHGRLQEVMDVFAVVANPDAFMWSSLISAHAKHGQHKQAIQLYHRMRGTSVKPDGHVFVAALRACARGRDLEAGKQVHGHVLATGVEPDVFVGSCLVDMYAKCGSLEDARRVFDGLAHKNVVTWTSLIAGHAQQGMGKEALRLYRAMQEEGMAVPNAVTFVCLLQACARLGIPALKMGKELHTQIREQGHQDDEFVANSLVNMYAKCGSLEEAQRVFDGLGRKDVVTWNAMIAGFSQHGMGPEALRLYSAMQEDGTAVVPDSVTFVSLLQACASVGSRALEKGKHFHAQIRERGHLDDVVVVNSLINMYAKCGSLEDAQSVFDGLGQKNVVTWNAMIAGYAQQGMGQEALRLYSSMQDEGIAVPDSVTFVSLLQACASVGKPALDMGKQLHAQIRKWQHQDDMFVGNSLVSMYAKCGSLEAAKSVFDGLGKKNVVTWNAMIAGYSQQGMGQEAFRLYRAMQDEGIAVPDSVTFVCLLQACASLGTPALEMGKQLHAQIRERGHQADVFVGNSLVNMYAKCGSLEDAQKLFDGLGQKNVVTWNAMIAGFSQQGMGQEALRLYSAMQAEGINVPNSVTFVSLLQACASVGTPALEIGKQLHGQIKEQGHQADVFVANSLLNMYAKCGSLEDAQRVFDELCKKDVVMWNAMIAGYSKQGMGQEALRLYSAMQEEGIAVPDAVTFVCLLQACASVGTPALEMGKHIHKQIRELRHQADVFVGNSLVNMYAKCGSLEDAQRVFDRLGEKNVVTWNAMIAGLSQKGMGQEALRLYSAMQEEGIAQPTSVTYVCILQACSCVGTPALETGKEIHAEIREHGHQADVFVANSLVKMYAKCGSLDDAQRVFEGLGQKDLATWNAMIAGYSQQGMGQEALRLHSAMQEEGITVPNSTTFVSLLQACANLAALQLGKQLHAQIEEQGLQTDVFVAGSLINMYGKSGSMMEARQVFDALPERDVVVWSALIAGYTCQGDSKVVFDMFRRMREDGIPPVGVTFLSVLTVCSHAGLVDKGKEYFEAMSKEYGITPSVEHYTCMVGLLGRAGRLDEALAFVKSLPRLPNAAVWHTLLGACQKWSNVEVGLHAFDEALKLDSKDTAAYVLMSNIYTGAQMWEQAQKMQVERLRLEAWKQPGQSWWTDLDGLVHSFLVSQETGKAETGIL